MEQNLDGSVWISGRYGAQDVKTLAIPHARRAADKLAREFGELTPTFPLYRALLARVAQGGAITGVQTIDGAGTLLRGEGGHFSGAIRPGLYLKGAS